MSEKFEASLEKPLLIVYSGLTKTGKTAGINHMVEAFDSRVNHVKGRDIILSHIISQEVKQQYAGRQIPREEYTEAMHRLYSSAAQQGLVGPYARIALEHMVFETPIVIFDNTRNQGDLEYFNTHYSNTMLIGMAADFGTILSRMLSNHDPLDGYTGLGYAERVEKCSKAIEQEIRVFRPELAIDYINQVRNGFVIDTAGQQNNDLLYKKLNDIMKGIDIKIG